MGNNNMSKPEKPKDKLYKNITTILSYLIVISVGYMIYIKKHSVSAEELKSLSEFAMSIILAIVALGIGVMQIDKDSLQGDKGKVSKDGLKIVYKNYIFSLFVTILVVLIGYLISIFCKDCKETLFGISFLSHWYFVILTVWLFQIINTACEM